MKSLTISVRQSRLGKNNLYDLLKDIFQLMTFVSVSLYHLLNRGVPKGKDKYMQDVVGGQY